MSQTCSRVSSDSKAMSQTCSRSDSNVTDLQQGQQRLESGQHRLENSVNTLRGDALETKMPTRLCDMLRARLDIRRLQIFWMARHQTPPMSRSEYFIRTLEDATDNGIITDDEELRLFTTDMVIRSLRQSDGSRLWIAAEASGVIDQNDIERARRSALTLQKIHGEDAAPVVYGYSISERQRQQAAATPELQEVYIFVEPDQALEEH